MQTNDVIAPSSGQSVYYTGSYWNDFPRISKEINQRATGDPKQTWSAHFFSTHKKPFKKVLMLNCGNGWLERELYKNGYIKDLVGVDYDDGLLKEAREKSKKMPFKYYKMDINSAKFPEQDFDLVINHASGHHIANLNKVFNELLKIVTDNSIFLNYDYVGPHRNQYPFHQWDAVHRLNRKLPASCRQELTYPHLPTMLVTDPSEAVHSELLLETMKRFFDFKFFKPLGGALAYPLLTHNSAIQSAPKKDVKKALDIIIKADAEHLGKKPDSTMFAYWAARPRKSVLTETAKLKAYQREENRRETASLRNKGHYYDLALIQELNQELDDLRITKQHKEAYIEELQKKIDSHSLYLRKAKSIPRKVKHTLIRIKSGKSKPRPKKRR